MDTNLSRYWGAFTFRGIAGILFGLATFFWPGISLLALVTLFGVYALFDGSAALFGAITGRTRGEAWGAQVFEGFVGIVAGLVTFLLPAITALALVYIIAAWALITGVMEISMAIRFRKEIAGEWLMALSGIASIGLAVLLMLRPGPGAVALVWLIGSYAIIFGVILLGLAFRLRKLGPDHRRHTPAHA